MGPQIVAVQCPHNHIVVHLTPAGLIAICSECHRMEQVMGFAKADKAVETETVTWQRC